MISKTNILFVLVAPVLMISCTDSFFTDDVICVAGGKTKTIEVVDQESNPITGAEFSVVNTRTGKEFCVDAKGNLDESCNDLLGETELTNQGEYILISEYNTANNQPTSDIQNLDIIEATIQKNGAVVKPRYVVIFGNNNCFPKHVKGPQVVVLKMTQ